MSKSVIRITKYAFSLLLIVSLSTGFLSSSEAEQFELPEQEELLQQFEQLEQEEKVNSYAKVVINSYTWATSTTTISNGLVSWGTIVEIVGSWTNERVYVSIIDGSSTGRLAWIDLNKAKGRFICFTKQMNRPFAF